MFRLSVKIAIRTAIVLTLLSTAALYLSMELGLLRVIIYSSSIFFTVAAVVYFVSESILKSRLTRLYTLIDQLSIQKEKFELNLGADLAADRKDELDDVLVHTIKAIEMIHKELKRLNKMENYRKEFIGDISHELKTPIFAIQGFVETLLNGALHDEEVNEVFLKKAMRHVNRLIFLTNDLMEISRLETGELKSTIKIIYLRDVVLDVIESLQYKAQQEEIELRLRDFNKNLQITADREQIKQVLTNLIENGMKYNRPGGYVEIGVREAENLKNKVVLYVKDNGIGIDGEDINRVTERFYRVDKSRSRDKGGTGLGLAIVKHIIEAHGEKLKIESKPDIGSEFSFTLTKATAVSV